MVDMENNELLEIASRMTPQWLGGFFDGEGCVCIRRHNGTGWILRVNLTQANHPLLLDVARTFKASYGPYTKTRKTKLGKESTCYEIGWANRESLVQILNVLKDHVIAKREQVELAIEFLGTGVGQGNKFSTEVLYRRYEIMERMRAINHAGPRKPASETIHATEEENLARITDT